MKSLFLRALRLLRAPRFSLGLFGALALVTACITFSGATPSLSVPTPLSPAKPPGAFSANATLIKSKFVQGETGEAVVKIDITTPSSETDEKKLPTDIVVALDRSGSMASDNKMLLAKQALRALVEHLSSEDRFALVTFDTSAETAIPLSKPDKNFGAVIDAIHPGGSTNLSGGVEKAMIELHRGTSPRKRIVLISDGQANIGIIDPAELRNLAGRISKQEAVLSTIGVGLDFNEVVMASMADQGMGEYAYLNNASQLGDVLAKQLKDSRSVYASASELKVNPGSSVTITDASGYLIANSSVTGDYLITSGSLGSNLTKTFYLTYSIPTSNEGNVSLGTIDLELTRNGNKERISVTKEPLQVAVLPVARRNEVIASVDKQLYEEGYLKNSIGKLKRDLNEAIRSNNRIESQSLVEKLNSKVAEGKAYVDAPALKKAGDELSSITRQAEAAFGATKSDQKKLAKELQQSGFKDQRIVSTNK